MNTTAQNNKLIAEFMQLEKYSNNEYLANGMICNENILYYHSDWNWLMEVVEKIESLNFTTSIYHLPKSLNTVKIISGGADVVGINGSTKIESVYNAMVEFVKWYTQQSK